MIPPMVVIRLLRKKGDSYKRQENPFIKFKGAIIFDKPLELDLTQKDLYALVIKDVVNALEGLTVSDATKVLSLAANEIILHAIVQGK